MVSITATFIAFVAFAGSLAIPLDSTLVDRCPNFDLELQSGLTLARRQSYSTDYTTGGGTVNYSPSSTGPYTVSFSGASDFVVGKGWNPGSASSNIKFASSFSASSGTVTLSLYGWTTSPLVEYYVVEDYNIAPVGSSVATTLTSDGSSYNVYVTTRVNKPSILGTSTFVQVKSVRTSPRSSGTITLANHFSAWKNAGVSFGTQNLQVLATEGYNSASGSVSVTSLSYA